VTAGRVIEGVYSNLFLVRDGVLLTADLSRCGVAGVMRAALLEQAPLLGIAVQVCDLRSRRCSRLTKYLSATASTASGPCVA
jgi:branched-subunit amino acid aminotransferase/4-amino-4-deoxychorismate lyase